MIFRAALYSVGGFAAILLRAENTQAFLVITADQHSSYERTAQFVAKVKAVHSANPDVPMAILIDGDTFEAGNTVALRSGGAIEYAMFRALAATAPTILNIGNHETEFTGMAETIGKIQATGVTVISNAINHETGQAFVPSMDHLRLGSHEATVVGVATDHLATYRVAVRPTLDLSDPVAWAKKNFPILLAHADWPIVMTHTGVKADREMFSSVPVGALFIGAHDHLRFVTRQNRIVYVHSGSWNDFVTIAKWRLGPDGHGDWEIEQIPLITSDPADPEILKTTQETFTKYQTETEREVVGKTELEMSPTEAAHFVVEALRKSAGADVAIVGGTTFGAGFPQGAVTRYQFNACVRFDGAVYITKIQGAQLLKFLTHTNQGPDTPFAERLGENLIAAQAEKTIDPARIYRLATVDWIVKNKSTYLGDTLVDFTLLPDQHLKAIALTALSQKTASSPLNK